MDPKNVAEHLQPLMEGLTEDLSMYECEELPAAIYESKDMFSSGPEDMGQTNLVTHSTDTGQHRPMHDDLTSLNKMWKRPKPSKCWIVALLSHARAAGPAQLFWLPRKMAQISFAWTIGRSTKLRAKTPTCFRG